MHLKALDAQLAVLGAPESAAAEVALARGLAALLDHDPAMGAEIWREYRFALKALREVLGSGSDESAEFWERLGAADLHHGAN